MVILEATEVESDFDDDDKVEPGEGLGPRCNAHVVAGPRGGKRKR